MAHLLIVEARFYEGLNDMLLAGVRGALDAAGHSHETITVPGALEIPGAISLAVESGRYDAYVAVGIVIRGEQGAVGGIEADHAVHDSACQSAAVDVHGQGLARLKDHGIDIDIRLRADGRLDADPRQGVVGDIR